MGLFSRNKKEEKLGPIPAPPPYVPANQDAVPSDVAQGSSPPPLFPQTPPLQNQEPEERVSDPTPIPNIRFAQMDPDREQKRAAMLETPIRLTDPSIARPRSIDERTPSPLFVSLNDYQRIVEGIEQMKQTLGQTEGHISKIVELKTRQEKAVDDWRHHLEEVQKKLSYIDEVVFQTR